MSAPVSSWKASNSSSERSAILMLSSSANCARIPPAALLVEPEESVSRSSSTTSSTPSRRRWKAALAPSAPPPTTTASAVRGTSTRGSIPLLVVDVDRAGEQVAGPRLARSRLGPADPVVRDRRAEGGRRAGSVPLCTAVVQRQEREAHVGEDRYGVGSDLV